MRGLLSTYMLNKEIGISDIRFTKLCGMATKQRAAVETLAEYVTRVMQERKLSFQEVEDRSRRGGRRGISRGYVNQIASGKFQNPSRLLLLGLAHGLGVSEDEVFAVARGEASPAISEYNRGEYEKMFEDVQQELTPDEMQHFNRLMQIVRREVERMIEERPHATPRKKGSKS